MKRWKLIVGLIFVLSIAIRLYLAFLTPYLSVGGSYFILKEVAHIKATGLPLIYDNLSYQGRTHIILPFFYYILALFSWVLSPINLGKIIPNILASLLPVVVYLIGVKITNSKPLAAFGALVSIVNPVYLSETFNLVSIQSIMLPLEFMLLYLFISNKKRSNNIWFVLLTFIVSLTSPLCFLLAVGFIIYYILVFSFNFKQRKGRVELGLFYLVTITWVNLIFYKNALYTYGWKIFWQNIPSPLLNSYFTPTSLFRTVQQIGLIPILFAFFTLYYYLFKRRDHDVYVLIGFLFANVFIMWLKIIQPTVGLMYVNTIIILLFLRFCKDFKSFIRQTRFDRFRNLFLIFFIVAFSASFIFSSASLIKNNLQNTPDSQEIKNLILAKFVTSKNSTILGSLNEGNLINYYARRKNLMDTDFLLAPKTSRRYKDLYTIYTTLFETERIRLLDKYNIKYILLTNFTKKNLGDVNITLTSSKCFKPIKGSKTIYEVMCTLQ